MNFSDDFCIVFENSFCTFNNKLSWAPLALAQHDILSSLVPHWTKGVVNDHWLINVSLTDSQLL